MTKFSRGDWRVMRNCCTSGTCVRCHHNVKANRPSRIVHTDRVSKEWAEHVVKGWPLYDAKAEKMESTS